MNLTDDQIIKKSVPPDDLKIVTVKWLKSCGFKKRVGWNGHWIDAFRLINHGTSRKPTWHATWGESRIGNFENPTRLRIKLLACALNVTLKC